MQKGLIVDAFEDVLPLECMREKHAIRMQAAALASLSASAVCSVGVHGYGVWDCMVRTVRMPPPVRRGRARRRSSARNQAKQHAWQARVPSRILKDRKSPTSWSQLARANQRLKTMV